MKNDPVLGYRRPAMLGGPVNPDPDVLTVRWLGTANYELSFRDRVLLLDTFYDRGPRMRPLGFRLDEVERADAILIGHPHYDHISDAAQIAVQTGASVVVHPLGADVLTSGGLAASKIIASPAGVTGTISSSLNLRSGCSTGSTARSTILRCRSASPPCGKLAPCGRATNPP